MTDAAALNNLMLRVILTMTATIYGRTGGTGPYNLAVKTNLACRVEQVLRLPNATSEERAEAAARGTFWWDTGYILPEQGVQIEVDAYPGVRWNPVAGTLWPGNVPNVGVIARSCDVRRA